jgi:predicted DNA-binding transcriptional regulator YafY
MACDPSRMGDPTFRVLELLSLLQTHRFWTGAELSERLEVSQRTLRRDVDRLRSLGYPVDATPGAAGGYRLGAGAHMPPLLLDDDEAVAIAVGLRAAAGASVEGIEETSLRALAKLDQVLPDRLRRRVGAVHSNVVPLRWGGVPTAAHVDGESLAVLSQACRDREQVRFEYQRRDGESSRRLVEPHQLVSAGRRWYLVAWDVRRGDWRTFRIDRLVEPRLAGVRFQPRQLPARDAAAFVEQALRSMPSRFHAEVTVGAPADSVRPLARHLGGEVEDIDGERCLVRLGADRVDWLATNIGALAVDFPISVDGPPELMVALGRLSGHLLEATGNQVGCGPGDRD